MPNASCDIGLVGLAVMGQNLALNMNGHGYKLAVFNRTVSKVDDFINNEAKGTVVVGAHSMKELAHLLKWPRRVMLMVKACDTVDKMIDQVLPYLEEGDIIIDGGNPAAWPHVKEIFPAISAKVDGGVPGCEWVGENGTGHYVKMVHNGRNYGDMQLICEAYQLLKDAIGLTPDELHEVFAE